VAALVQKNRHQPCEWGRAPASPHRRRGDHLFTGGRRTPHGALPQLV